MWFTKTFYWKNSNFRLALSWYSVTSDWLKYNSIFSGIELENEDNCQIDDDIKNTSEVRKEITKFEETVAVPDENEQSFVNSSNFVDPNCEKGSTISLISWNNFI